jgi:hypothetical protein
MPLPQVNERIKEIPAQTLRAVFAGIGQMLLIADKLRARAVEQISDHDAAPATKPADAARPAEEAPSRPPQAPDKPARPARAKPAAPPAQPQRPRWRSLDETGNVRLLDEGEDDLASEADAATTADASTGADAVPGAAPAKPAPAEPEPAEPAPAQSPPAAATTTQAAPPTPAAGSSADAAALPLANYDQLSLASLRARLRVLDATQVSLLLDYEKGHESRPDVVTMFERRIAKLNEGS